MKSKFGPGDKVFAKVRGYPPWPARVEGLADETPNRMRYHIYFYGTAETGVVKAEDICSFVENRGTLGKPKKHRNFKDALEQIEAELSPEEVQSCKEILQRSIAASENEESVTEDGSLNNSAVRSTSNKSGKLSAKREKKRRIESENSIIEEIEQKKAKTSNSQNSTEDQTSLKGSPEVLSRSGRKIKPKRFADFEDSPSDDPNALKNSSKLQYKINRPSTKLDETDKSPEGEMIREDIFVEINGEKVEIPLNLNRPAFKSSKAGDAWDIMVKDYALSLKKQIENGKSLEEPIEKHMENWTKNKLKCYETAQEERDVKLSNLRVETLLLDLDSRIKCSLSLNKAEPEKCLILLDELLELDITSLMLKKHPEIVETIKKMRKYVGNTAHWRMNGEETSEFHKQASFIRKKSETVYSKFKNLFLVPNGKSFWEVFAKELGVFNKKTENMTMEQVFSLVKEPE